MSRRHPRDETAKHKLANATSVGSASWDGWSIIDMFPAAIVHPRHRRTGEEIICAGTVGGGEGRS